MTKKIEIEIDMKDWDSMVQDQHAFMEQVTDDPAMRALFGDDMMDAVMQLEEERFDRYNARRKDDSDD